MTTPEPGPRLITKYPNRRLYDTEDSRYITLDELAALIRGGARVKVVDARTRDDLTRQVLTQVILEEQERLDLLPVDLLHLVIRAQGTVQAAPLARFLSQSFQQFVALGDTWNRQWGALFGTMGGAPAASPREPDAGATSKEPSDAGARAESSPFGLASQWVQAVQSAVGGVPWPFAAPGAPRPEEARPPEPAAEEPPFDGDAPAETGTPKEPGPAPTPPSAEAEALRQRMDDLLRRLRKE